jgi:hypothetical protein
LASFASLVAYLEVTAVKDIVIRYQSSLVTYKGFERQILDSESILPIDIQRMTDAAFTELSFWYSLKRERQLRPIH